MRKQMISVPSSSVLNTVHKLPRMPKEAGLIPVMLKRKKEYKSYHKREYINPKKIFYVLDLLKKYGHPHYQFYNDFSSYKERCKTQDVEGHKMLFGNDIVEEAFDSKVKFEKPFDEIKVNEYSSSDSDSENEGKEKQNDPIRRHQFDHNRNTCLTNNYPEANVDRSGKEVANTKELIFAPAEGYCPTNILEEKDWDIKSWPTLHPDGRFGLHFRRKIKLTDQQYFGQRILNEDLRFAKSPSYIFGSAAYIEKKILISHANISYMRGKKTVGNDGKPQYDLEDAFTTFEGVKNTPKYWQKVKYDMIAKLENIGPFHLFFTLSCGDTRCDENFSSYLAQNGYTLEYIVGEDGTTQTIVKKKGNLVINKELYIFLQEDVDESHHELIRTNVMTATRNFHHRVETFRKEIIFGRNNPMAVKYISSKDEELLISMAPYG